MTPTNESWKVETVWKQLFFNENGLFNTTQKQLFAKLKQ